MGKTKEMFHEEREQYSDRMHGSEFESAFKPVEKETGLSLELQDWKNITKSSIKEKVDAMITVIHEGSVDPIEALIYAKKGVETFTDLEKNVRELAEAVGVGKAGLEKFNVKVSEAMTGVKYDYTNCGDYEWGIFNQQMESAKASMKEREKFLSSLTKPMEILVNECEVIKVNPPIKSGKLGLKIEMK